MTRAEIEAILAGVRDDARKLKVSDVESLCTALLESMDRVDVLTAFFVADEAVQQSQRSVFDSVIDGEVPKETRRGYVELCIRRSAARLAARKSLGGSNER